MSKDIQWRWADPSGQQRLIRNDELIAALANGVIAPNAPVWRSGWKEWKPADEVPELMSHALAAENGLVPNIPPPPLFVVAAQAAYEGPEGGPTGGDEPPPPPQYVPAQLRAATGQQRPSAAPFRGSKPPAAPLSSRPKDIPSAPSTRRVSDTSASDALARAEKKKTTLKGVPKPADDSADDEWEANTVVDDRGQPTGLPNLADPSPGAMTKSTVSAAVGFDPEELTMVDAHPSGARPDAGSTRPDPRPARKTHRPPPPQAGASDRAKSRAKSKKDKRKTLILYDGDSSVPPPPEDESVDAPPIVVPSSGGRVGKNAVTRPPPWGSGTERVESSLPTSGGMRPRLESAEEISASMLIEESESGPRIADVTPRGSRRPSGPPLKAKTQIGVPAVAAAGRGPSMPPPLPGDGRASGFPKPTGSKPPPLAPKAAGSKPPPLAPKAAGSKPPPVGSRPPAPAFPSPLDSKPSPAFPSPSGSAPPIASSSGAVAAPEESSNSALSLDDAGKSGAPSEGSVVSLGSIMQTEMGLAPPPVPSDLKVEHPDESDIESGGLFVPEKPSIRDRIDYAWKRIKPKLEQMREEAGPTLRRWREKAGPWLKKAGPWLEKTLAALRPHWEKGKAFVLSKPKPVRYAMAGTASLVVLICFGTFFKLACGSSGDEDLAKSDDDATGETTAPSASTPPAPATSLAAPAPAPRSPQPAAAPCEIKGQPQVLAPSGRVQSGAVVLALDKGIGIGFAEDETNATALLIDPGTLEVVRSARQVTKDPIRRVVPYVDSRGQLSMAVNVDTDGDSVAERRTIAGPDGLIDVSTRRNQIVVSERDAKGATVVWKLTGAPKNQPEALVGVPISQPEPGFVVAFRRGNSIAVGAFVGDAGSAKAKGKLSTMNGLGDRVGSPAIASSGEIAMVIWADRAKGEKNWVLRQTRFMLGEAPEAPSTFSPPPGGPGEQTMSPGLEGLGDGRFLVVWTEGAGRDHEVRAITLGADGSTEGKPLALSTSDMNAGQGQPGVGSDGRGVVVFFVQGDEGFAVAATPIACKR